MPFPIIDAHQHLWDFDVLRPPWLRGAGLPLERSYTPDDYAEAAQGSGIVQSIYVEVGTDVADRETEAAYAAAQCADSRTALSAVVAGADVAAPDFATSLQRMTEIAPLHLRGVRSGLPNGRDTHAIERFVQGARLLTERGPYHIELLVGPNTLALAAQIAAACPDTRFIVNHCGGINPWAAPEQIDAAMRDLARFATLPQVAVKISGLINRAPATLPGASEERAEQLTETLAPVIHDVWDRFGQERVLFGSDWPVCNVTSSLREWVSVVRQIVATHPQSAQDGLLYGNAKRWYRLS